MDKIIVNNLHFESVIGVDSWERNKRQPLIISVVFFLDISPSGDTDQLQLSISYADIAKRVKQFAESSSFRSMEAFSWAIINLCFQSYALPQKVTVILMKPKGLLHAKYPGIQLTRTRDEVLRLNNNSISDSHVSYIPKDGGDVLFIKDLCLKTVVGVNPWEREEKQNVIINLEISLECPDYFLVADKLPKSHNYRKIAKLVSKLVEHSEFLTIEALITVIAKLIIINLNLPRVTLSVEKPSALLFADSACIKIERSRKDYNISESHYTGSNFSNHTAYIGFGTNLGNRSETIHAALDMLEEQGIVITDSSFLYESSPMYVTNQPLFLNGAIKAKTTLSPPELLTLIKQIEENLGRDFSAIRNGPRVIDLDILFFDDLEITSEHLIVPHPRIQEREFVLKPLCDIAPEFEHPKLSRTCQQLLALLKHQDDTINQVYRVLPISDRMIRWDSPRTIIMGILNTTPDSFSDGGMYNNLTSAVKRAFDMAQDGASIIDIGGQSTRPGAEEVSAAEELNRVINTIESIRNAGRSPDTSILATVPISIDTFRAEVASKAIKAGANMINDVTGGEYDIEMANLWKISRLPICIMHMRGTPKTMSNMTSYEDVVLEVRDALGEKVKKMIGIGIRRWNIIIDPGIGFAKDTEQNFTLLKNLPRLVAKNSPCVRMPLLIGVSRKAFIGKTIGDSTDASGESRKWGTAGACCSAISSGANILRVHDVKEMHSVISIADKCFKQ